MAKKVTLINIDRDTKELGVVNGRRIVLGSSLDADNVDLRVAKPEIELTQAEYDELRKSPAVEQAIEYWTNARPPKVLVKVS